MVCRTSIDLASSDYIPVAADQTLAVDLHKIGASVTGTAVLQDAANINGLQTVPAEDATCAYLYLVVHVNMLNLLLL